MMKSALCAAVAALLVAGAFAAGTPVCENKTPSSPKNIKMTSTTYSSSTKKSTMNISWDHAGDNRCVSKWVVDVYPQGKTNINDRIQTVTLDASSPISGKTWAFTTANPGSKYEFFIYGRNPSLGASGNGGGLRSAPLGPAAPAPAVCDAKTPGSPKNIKLNTASNAGATSKMTIVWDHAGDGRCVNQWVVDVYEAGKTQASQRIATQAINTQSPYKQGGTYQFATAVPGKNYVFYVRGVNPSLGASGNGAGLMSAAFFAPVGVTTGPATVPPPAPAPACDAKTPGAPKNIKLNTASNAGATSKMTIVWDHAGDGRCVKQWVVDVYEAGKNQASQRITTSTINTSSPYKQGGTYQFSNATPGLKYEFFIHGVNSALGASGNGAGLRSAPFMAPVGVTPGRRL